MAPKLAAFATRWLTGLSRRRIVIAVGLGAVGALLLSPIFITPLPELMARTVLLSVLLMLAYTLAGNWRQRWMAPWAAQVLAVVLTAPAATFAVYVASSGGDIQAFVSNPWRVSGFLWISGSAAAVGVIFAFSAIVRERDARGQAQALQFELERATLERQATDAQLRLLRAQVEPHFLFNTLANVQALVETGSPRAAPVLRSLIAYLRAAMPRLRDDDTTLGNELALVRAYLELMHLRMPDRLHYAIDVPEDLHALRFPAMGLLTLVENAVRHGIDPSEAGGRIDIGARRDADALRLWVADTGVGFDADAAAGTGLANLRQRLAGGFGDGVALALRDSAPERTTGRGLHAEIVLTGAALAAAGVSSHA